MNFWIPGDPAPQSRSGVVTFIGEDGKRKGRGFPRDSKRAKIWRKNVKAVLAVTDKIRFDNQTGFVVDLWFHIRRPKDHYVSNNRSKPLKDDAPELHLKLPDRDNIDKLILDEMKKAKFFPDDCHVCDGRIIKTWSEDPGCLVSVRAIRTYAELMEYLPFGLEKEKVMLKVLRSREGSTKKLS